ncbi:MAG: hypothetical protein ABIJ45_13655 [Candidatus Zixiibacteriota bacterium]|uniref:Uncharacterized protein n=1 Tax=viral metagenome TaxID=1070528 RepID=A0A6M3IDH7_9ZZZZ
MKHEESVVYVLFVDRGDYYDNNQLHSIYKSKIKAQEALLRLVESFEIFEGHIEEIELT